MLNRTMWITAVAGLCAAAHADFDLQITEIWPGNDPGDNLTEDWFELTNAGDTAWVAAEHGALSYDDESFDPTDAALMSGIDAIEPGESVIFVNAGEDGAAGWVTLWSEVVNPLPQVGAFDGAGLSQGGDAVAVWVSFGAPVGDPTVTATYPDAEADGGQSYDTVLAAFSEVGNAAGAVATTTVNDKGQPAIGSPGSVAPMSDCLADCDGSGSLDILDFVCYQGAFVAGDLAQADCDANGVLNVLDFVCYQGAFQAGCP